MRQPGGETQETHRAAAELRACFYFALLDGDGWSSRLFARILAREGSQLAYTHRRRIVEDVRRELGELLQ